MLKAEEIRRIHQEFGIPCRELSLRVVGLIQQPQYKGFFIALEVESCMPTNAELMMLMHYMRFQAKRCSPSPEMVLKRKFPAIVDFNTISFLKGDKWPPNGNEGWCYRKDSWDMGCPYFPQPDTPEPNPPPWTLPQLLEHLIYKSERKDWDLLKKEQHTVFPQQ